MNGSKTLKLNSSLTDKLLHKSLIEKWNGKFPTVYGEDFTEFASKLRGYYKQK